MIEFIISKPEEKKQKWATIITKNHPQWNKKKSGEEEIRREHKWLS